MKLIVLILLMCAAVAGASPVSLDVQVIDSRSGETLELLGPNDFQVYSDGERVPIMQLDIETKPVDLVFLIYFSKPGLSTPQDRQRFVKGLQALSGFLRPGDRAGVVRGRGSQGVALSLTSNRAALDQALLAGS